MRGARRDIVDVANDSIHDLSFDIAIARATLTQIQREMRVLAREREELESWTESIEMAVEKRRHGEEIAP